MSPESTVGFIECFNGGYPVNPICQEKTARYYESLVEHIKAQRPEFPIHVLHLEGKVDEEEASWVVCYTDTAHEELLDDFYYCRTDLPAPCSGEVISAHSARISACLAAIEQGSARQVAAFEQGRHPQGR